jgi:hypothetical protein
MISRITAVSVLASLTVAAMGAPKMHEYDRSTKNRTGLKASDVCLSYRFFRRVSGFPLRSNPETTAGSNPETTAVEDVMRMWRPSRIQWSYVSTPETIKTVEKAGLVFEGTLNTIAWDGPDQDAELFDGSREVAPWMTAFHSGKGVGWACVNKAPTLPRRIEQLRKYRELGVNTIQHDDWTFNLHGFSWGGCFCKDCRREFAEYLAKNAAPEDMRAAGVETWEGFDYLDYLKTKLGRTSTKDYLDRRASDPLSKHFRMFQLLSTRDYFEKLVSGRDIHLSVNGNTTPASLANNFLLDLVDYLEGETPLGTTDDLWNLVYALKMADAVNLPQVISPAPRGKPVVEGIRKAIALSYALGHRMLVPWDVYVGSEKDRWFGTVEEYGDLYDFVRANAGLLDDYEPWGNVVVTVPISYSLAPTTAAREATRLLMRAGYPCRYAAYGTTGEIVHVPVNPADFRNASAVVDLKATGTDPKDEADLTRATEGLNVVDFEVAGAPARDYRAVVNKIGELRPPAYRIDDANVLALPRWKPGDPKAPRVVHLVRLGGDSRRVSLWVSDEIRGSHPSADAVLLQPGKPAQNVTAQESAGGLRLSDLDVETWGVIVIPRT